MSNNANQDIIQTGLKELVKYVIADVLRAKGKDGAIAKSVQQDTLNIIRQVVWINAIKERSSLMLKKHA